MRIFLNFTYEDAEQLEKWVDLKTLVCIKSIRIHKGKTTQELRYYMSSLASDTQRIGQKLYEVIGGRKQTDGLTAFNWGDMTATESYPGNMGRRHWKMSSQDVKHYMRLISTTKPKVKDWEKVLIEREPGKPITRVAASRKIRDAWD